MVSSWEVNGNLEPYPQDADFSVDGVGARTLGFGLNCRAGMELAWPCVSQCPSVCKCHSKHQSQSRLMTHLLISALCCFKAVP